MTGQNRATSRIERQHMQDGDPKSQQPIEAPPSSHAIAERRVLWQRKPAQDIHSIEK